MFADLLLRLLNGVCPLSDEQIEQLEQHYQLLIRWNRVLNLTTVRKPEEIVTRHYCESLFLGTHLPSGSFALADIGSGAGFPGIPVAILRPECSITLIESHQRKAVFLKESGRMSSNVRVLARRAEDVAERFNWAVSRAVKYSEIRAVLTKLAGSVALLAGEAELPGINWHSRIPVPWGERRFLYMGVVSRET